MKKRTSFRLFGAAIVALGPIATMAACGGSDPVSVPEDAATDAALVDTLAPGDATLDARADSRADAGLTDASHTDAAKNANPCGGYAELDLAGHPVTPGDSCGACADGNVVCIASDSVACADATAPPCATPPVDAGPNACGGYGKLTFLGADASIGDSCGECGLVACATSNSLACMAGNGYCTKDAGLQSTCTIPDSAWTAPPPTLTLPPETRPTVTSRSSIGLPANDLVANPYDGLLYASLGQGISQGNSVVAIDPASASVLRSLYVGPGAGFLALSDDGKALWVLVNGSYAVSARILRIDLATFTAASSIDLPQSSTIDAIRVLPGTEGSVVVSRTGGYGSSVIVYDDGVPRPYGFESGNRQSQLVVSGSGSLLFSGSPNLYPNGLMSSLCIDGNGAFLRSTFSETTFNDVPSFYGGVIYRYNGSAYDAKTGTLLHTFTPPPAQYTDVTTDVNDVYYLTSTYESGSYWVQVTGFDRASYASTVTDLLQTNGGSAGSFTRWGRYGFAYLIASSSIEIVHSTIIPDMP